jgi:hypothetical protein
MALVPIMFNEPGLRKYVEDHSTSDHDNKVLALISRVIDEKYNGTLRNRGGSTIATVSYVLEKCQVPDATRSSNGETIGRDAEYYFKSRWVVACHKWMLMKVAEAIWMDAQNLGYNLVKVIAFTFHLEKRLQTDSGAISRPGGIFWGFKGALDGLKDNPDALVRPFSPTFPPPPAPGLRPIQMA